MASLKHKPQVLNETIVLPECDHKKSTRFDSESIYMFGKYNSFTRVPSRNLSNKNNQF